MGLLEERIFSGKKCRLLSMILMSTMFFFVEVAAGCITNSTALTADSFHMLTDIAAMLISFISAKVSTMKWKRNTFGWARAGVMGGLVNAVFLVAVCLTTIIKACKHFSEGSMIQEPKSLVIVGILGLIVNVIGLCLFYKHGVGHSHSHGREGKMQRFKEKQNSIGQKNESNGFDVIDLEQAKCVSAKKSKRSHREDTSDLNMRGAFLHVLSDALGSVIVVISAWVIWKTNWQYRFHLDPGLSIVWVIVILRSAWPLLRESALILLQSVPKHLNIDDLRKRLLNLDNVLNVHEFHVWQLTGTRIIATAHIHCENLNDYMNTAERVKAFFHNEGIHSTTIQAEFFEPDKPYEDSTEIDTINSDFCALSCPITEEYDCFKDTCCQINHKKMGIKSAKLISIMTNEANYQNEVTL